MKPSFKGSERRKLALMALISIGGLTTNLARAGILDGCSPATPTGCITKNVPELNQPGYVLVDTLISGFFGPPGGSYLIDLNGNMVKSWPIGGFSKLLPGGHFMAGYYFNYRGFLRLYEDCVVEQDWNGNVVWPSGAALMDGPSGSKLCDPDKQVVSLSIDEIGRPAAPLHHEFQRKNDPVGYFAPSQDPILGGGTTLILAQDFPGTIQRISIFPLYNDKIYEVEVGNTTNVLWTWDPVDHFDPAGPGDLGLGFTPVAKAAIESIQILPFGEPDHASETDWLHSNAVSYIGANQWCPNVNAASCDHRFEPDNVIWNSREANITAIIARHDRPGFWSSGAIVWRLGPDFPTAPPGKLDQLIGPHNPHIIPRGLPGAGDMLVFDNGGAAGYSATGVPRKEVFSRPYSRVIEFNPITLDVIWEYQRPGSMPPAGENFAPFFSSFLANAQRLPNGDTQISEAETGRVFEVTPSGQLVWEFVNPFPAGNTPLLQRNIFRAYRVPFNWIPNP